MSDRQDFLPENYTQSPPTDPQLVNAIGWTVLASLIGVLWFAQAKPGQSQAAPQMVPVPTTVPGAVAVPAMPTPTASTTPRVLKFTLSLAQPDDLKVQQGDYVDAGHVLADRTRQQQQLRAQRERVEISLQRIREQTILEPSPPAPIPPVAALPAASFAEEDTAIAELEDAIELQLRKVDLLASMPPSEVPAAMRDHEERELETRYKDLQAAQAQLQAAQKQRQHQEYEHSLAMAQRAEQQNQQDLAYSEQRQRVEQQKRDREFQIAQLEAQLQTIDGELQEFSTVRSPYSGTIRRVKWLGQSDNRLTVEITLAVGGSPGNSAQPDRLPVPLPPPGSPGAE